MGVSQKPPVAPRTGMVVRVAINTLSDKFKPFAIAGFDVGIVLEDGGQPFLRYRTRETDPKDWLFIYVKLRSFLTSLSIATFGHVWPDDRIYWEDEVVWTRPKVLAIVVDKEGDPGQPQHVTTSEAVRLIELEAHIATQYPEVWFYEEIGLYLLRNSDPPWQFYAEVLLNFFKIGELVTATRYKAKPGLRDVLRASKDLGVIGYSNEEIREFYKVRSRDAAHDWGESQPVSREQAVECKLWAEQMVYLDWWKHGTRVIRSRPTAAVVRQERAPPPAERG
jgi:hypothetical protein